MSLDAPTTPAAPEPRKKGPKHAAKRTRRRIWPRSIWAQAVIVAVILVGLLVGGYVGYLWYQSTRIHHIEVKGLTSAPTQAGTPVTENILMVGSTDRCALKVQNPIYGLCSQGVTGVNSDVVMILHLNWTTSTVSILSIPRDLFIPNARADGANKIDAALADGPSQLVAAIQQDFGIPIQHYVELNFDTFAGVVNALGGVKMYFPMPVFDAYSQLQQYSTGCVELNGTEALAVVRARHLQYKPNASYGSDPSGWPQESLSDLARIRRDHEFLRVLAAAVSAQGLGNPITDAKIVSSVTPQLTVDSGFTTQHMVQMVLHFHGVNTGSAPQYTLPVMTSTEYSYVYQGYDYGNVEFPDNEPDLATIQQFLGVSPSTNTMTGKALPAPSTITVAVQNGTGTYNQGADTATALQQRGFKIGPVGDATPVGNPAETLVAYNSTSPTVVADAQQVLRSISGQAILAYVPTNTSPVTVVTGTSFSILPPAATTTTTAPTTSTSTHTSTTTSNGSTTTTTVPSTTTTTTPDGFSPTSASSQPLQPWDPRSCTPSGGEGP